MLQKIRVISAAIFLFLNSAGFAPAGDPFPQAASSYLVMVDGKEVWTHDPDRRLAPASLTKIMTALLVLERTGMGDLVRVSRRASQETGTRLGLRAGDEFYAIDLLAATLLGSANDACHALAAHVSGNESRFVDLMNWRARPLKLANTHFTNACGHDHPGLYSTAHDLALLAETAMTNPIFAKMVSLVTAEIHTIDGKKTFTVENKNEMIGRYPGAMGVKTGFTPKAGKCLIAFAERGGSNSLLVLLNSDDRWWTATRIMDAAFAQISRTAPGP